MPTYNKNFLADVIFRIDFAPITALVQGEEPTAFEEKINSIYSIKEPLKQVGFRVENNNGELRGMSMEETIWNYKTQDGKVTVELKADFLVVNFKKYVNMLDLKEKVATILEAFFSSYEVTQIERLGLRYVDRIVLPEDTSLFDWSRYLKQNLIKNLDFIEDKNQLRRAMQSFELSLENDTNLNFKCGIFNSWYPDRLLQKEFFLDTDCYTQIAFSKTDINNKLDKFHEICSKFFEDSITQEFRDEVLNAQ